MSRAPDHESVSELFDDELSPADRAEATRHVAQCEQCQQELRAFAGLRKLVAARPSPAVSPSVWERIERAVDSPPQAVARAAESAPPRPHRRRSWRVPMIAACLLLTVFVAGTSWVVWRARHANRMTVDLTDYLDLFEQDPAGATKLIATKYQGTPLGPNTADMYATATTKVARGMGKGYQLDGAVKLSMPNCQCVHCTCRTPDGDTLAMFEHDGKHRVTFGRRPVVATSCGGVDCQAVRVGDRLAVSWQQGDHTITVVGARDLDEVETLMRRFQTQATP